MEICAKINADVSPRDAADIINAGDDIYRSYELAAQWASLVASDNCQMLEFVDVLEEAEAHLELLRDEYGAVFDFDMAVAHIRENV